VSAEKRDGEVVYLRIVAEQGGTARVRMPETGEIKSFELAPGAEISAIPR